MGNSLKPERRWDDGDEEVWSQIRSLRSDPKPPEEEEARKCEQRIL